MLVHLGFEIAILLWLELKAKGYEIKAPLIQTLPKLPNKCKMNQYRSKKSHALDCNNP